METIGFYGLGAIGAHLATRLARAGHAVAVEDLDRARVDAWCAANASASHAAHDADVVVTCVTDQPAVSVLVLGDDGLARRMRPGTLLIDHTTTSASLAREMAHVLGERSVALLDAPASGGSAGAEQGALSIMAGADPATYARALPILSVYAARVTLMGPVGAGQLAKMANQICIAGAVRGLGEAVDFARAVGLDLDRMFDAFSLGTARSAQMEQHRRKFLASTYRFAPTFDWLDKDLRIALTEAAGKGLGLPMVDTVVRELAKK